MHLLMETAMGDSQQYEVLSFEEIDDLKKELSLLDTRIDATKRKLVPESKLRDAAQSLNRLYSPNASHESMGNGAKDSPKRHRRSILGSRGGSVDLLNKTDDEMASSAKKCEVLAQELWKMEKRAQDLQKRLLEHTAGVLQMTHKGFLKKDMPPQTPESLPDYLNGRDGSREINLAHDFDDLSFYRTLDSMLEVGDAQTNDRSDTFAQQTQTILETERKLENLNRRLRESIAQSTTLRQPMPAPPVLTHENEGGAEFALQDQLNYLEKGVEAIQQDRNVISQNAKQSAYAIEERLEDLNSQLHGIISRSGKEQNAGYPLPPQVSGQSTKEQIGYLENGLDTLEQSVQRFMDDGQALSSRAVGHEEKAEQFETTLLGLWDILIAEEDSKRQAQPNGQDEQAVPHEKFSLQSFSAKVQSLHVRVTDLQEQKQILKRQVQQQRDLNSKSDAQKDAQISEQTMALEQAKKEFEAKDREASETKNELALLAERFDASRQEAALQEQHALKEAKERFHAELQTKQHEVEKLEAEIAGLSGDYIAKLEESNQRIHDLFAEIEILKEAKAPQETHEESLTQAIEAKTQEAEKAQNEMKALEGEMVRLQTEVTIARAELDGAYGTRAQRAAEGIPNPAMQKELEGLNERNTSLLGEISALKTQNETVSGKEAEMAQRVQALQRELSETISEYEVMTKASIEFEKEREQLESYVDSIRDRCEALEGQLSEEKLRWLGVQSPGSAGREGMAPGTTSTSVLKNEFKKMMRETRAENMKALRVSRVIICCIRVRLTARLG